MGKPSDLVQGTLDLLILKTISLEPKHGWAIAKRIQQISAEVLHVQQGSLYPALHRLEQRVTTEICGRRVGHNYGGSLGGDCQRTRARDGNSCAALKRQTAEGCWMK